MPNLPEVKKRIESTKNTRKITQAMQLVAANKMKTFQKKAENSRAYAWSLLDGLVQTSASFENTLFGETRTSGKILFVLLTSDKGLAGSLNTRLIEALFRSPRWLETSPSERLLITIGRKSYEAAIRLDIQPVRNFQGLSEAMQPLDALAVINEIIGFWERKECREIILISPHYVNAFTVRPTHKTYLPFSRRMIETHFNWRFPESSQGTLEIRDNYLFFEPSEDEVVEAVGLQLIQMLFIQAFFELKASEYSSRMVAMKNATEAADERISELTLEFNKVRQGLITQQLAELAAGRQALEA